MSHNSTYSHLESGSNIGDIYSILLTQDEPFSFMQGGAGGGGTQLSQAKTKIHKKLTVNILNKKEI